MTTFWFSLLLELGWHKILYLTGSESTKIPWKPDNVSHFLCCVMSLYKSTSFSTCPTPSKFLESFSEENWWIWFSSSISAVVNVLEGVMEIESNLDYKLSSPLLKTMFAEFTRLLPSVLSGPKWHHFFKLAGMAYLLEVHYGVVCRHLCFIFTFWILSCPTRNSTCHVPFKHENNQIWLIGC